MFRLSNLFAFVRKSTTEEEFIVVRLHAKLSIVDIDVREGSLILFTNNFHIHQRVEVVLFPNTIITFGWIRVLVLMSRLEELALVAKQLLCEALIRLDEPALVTDMLRRLW